MKITSSLRHRSLRAGAWSGGGHITGQMLRLAGNLVLTRLLMPEAFGLMAVIAALQLTLNLVFDVGSGQVIVQSKRGQENAFLNTAWTLQIIRGLVIWVFSMVTAAGIAIGQAHHLFKEGSVYDDARLPWLIVATTFAMVLIGFGSVNGKLAERNLNLRKVATIDFGAQLFSTLAMILAAYLTRSVWALVLGSIVAAGFRCVLSHIFLDGPRAKLMLEKEAIDELIRKGKWVMMSSIISLVALAGDRLLLSGLFDGTTLGLYSIAFGLAGMAQAALSTLLAQVMLPTFSEIVRDRPEQLPSVYRKFQQITDLCIGSLAGFIFLASNVIIEVMYDPRYQGAAHIFALLAIGSIGARFLVTEQIYIAMGRTELLPMANFPRVVVLLVGLPLGHQMAGLNGALMAIVASSFVHWPIAIWFRSKNGLNSLRNDMYLPIALAAGLGLGWVVNHLWTLIVR